MTLQKLSAKAKHERRIKYDQQKHESLLSKGMKNVRDTPQKTVQIQFGPSQQRPPGPKKSILRDLIEDARKGHDDFRKPRVLEVNAREEKYQPNSAKSIEPPTLPSLQALQRLTRTLQDGRASNSDSYRPNYNGYNKNIHHSPPSHCAETVEMASPILHVASAYQVYTLPPTTRTYCQVSLCPHQHFCIDFAPSDPSNNNGSWIASLVHYWDHPWSQAQHTQCTPPDTLARCHLLATRIIQHFTQTEARKLAHSDRRNGASPRRPPSLAKVEREVRVMYSHISRGGRRPLLDKREAKAASDLVRCR